MSLVDSLCCKGQVPSLMPCTAARWPRLFINTHIKGVSLGTSEDQWAAAVGTMPISFKTAFLPPTSTPSVCNQWSGFLQKPCEIPGSGAVFRDVLYYFKAQSRINGDISLPQSISQKSGCLIRNHMSFPCFTMLLMLFSNMKMSDKNVAVPCVPCQND